MLPISPPLFGWRFSCAYACARQALFVFYLHRFTHQRQRVDRQCIRGEGFCASTFTRAAHAESGGEGQKMGGVFTPNARAIRLLRPQREG